jgi:hypothetical protein
MEFATSVIVVLRALHPPAHLDDPVRPGRGDAAEDLAMRFLLGWCSGVGGGFSSSVRAQQDAALLVAEVGEFNDLLERLVQVMSGPRRPPLRLLRELDVRAVRLG